MIRALIDWLRGRFKPTPPPSRPSYELVLRVDGPDGDGRFAWSLTAIKGGGSGYWSVVPQPWSVRAGDEIVSDGTWTYDFRFTDERGIAAGRSTLRPDNATALVAHFGTLTARLAPLSCEPALHPSHDWEHFEHRAECDACGHCTCCDGPEAGVAECQAAARPLRCPECAAGKHPSCAHFAFDADDEQVDCQCGCEPSRTCPSCSDTVPVGWTLDDHHNCNHPEDFT